MAKKLREIIHPHATKAEMDTFVGHHVENSKITHDGLRKKFIKHFGPKAHNKHFNKLISKHVD